MGRITPIDIISKGETLVRKGERISARHIRKIESSKIKFLEYGREDLEGYVLAKDLVDKKTGEVLLACNTIIDEESLSLIESQNLKEIDAFGIIYLINRQATTPNYIQLHVSTSMKP